ncbi:putative oxidoreductase C-terminal domain-containing protein [candidate division KSB1 bacterium]
MTKHKKAVVYAVSLFLIISFSCSRKQGFKFSGSTGEVSIITLDPGHFHAALVQKVMYDQVSPIVNIFAPEGPDLADHLSRINGFNNSTDNPTNWTSNIYANFDYFEKMIKKKPGNVVVISGNNLKKTDYIKTSVDAGLNVLADKPMCINKEGFDLLKEAFITAEKNNCLLYDIMTERYEITTILQKILANTPDIFGSFQKGTPEDPAVIKESVHHFFKYVSGNPIKRPAWYFDTDQQGEGIVDVTTHLVDLIQWACFPEEIIDYQNDVKMISARHSPTLIRKEQFEKVTGLSDFPPFLRTNLNENGQLPVYSNGEMVYTLKDIHAKVSVIWNFQAPQGTGDTHFSIMRGTKSEIIIRQGEEQKYRPELFIKILDAYDSTVESFLQETVKNLSDDYPGLKLEKAGNEWHVVIPDKFRIGHEAHFGQVTKKYLQFLIDGKLPDWEVPNMIAKYYTTTSALEMALRSN